jgi:hypothetical protein
MPDSHTPTDQSEQDLDTPAWYATASQAYGTLYGLYLDHPGYDLLHALNGNYQAGHGQTGSGIAQWVVDHPPAPVPETEG